MRDVGVIYQVGERDCGLWCPCCGSKLRVNPRTQQTQEEEEEEEGLQCICLTLEKWESSLDLTETMAASCSKCEIEFIILILNCAECEV